MAEKKKLRPVLDGEFWIIGENPELGDLQGSGRWAGGAPQECVDHHVFQSADGGWHLWGCIRHTAVNRLLYHWRSPELTTECWERTGEIVRVDRHAGEDLRTNPEQEAIQSPYVVRHDGLYYMFYGGGGTGAGGEHKDLVRQMCLLTSVNGRDWVRRLDEQGRSRLFEGPGQTRDPCVRNFGGFWHMYYAGNHGEGREEPGFYLRTSEDLIHWSDWKLVHQDLNYGAGHYETECPHVVRRSGYYYLFRTANYAAARSHVFRSEDPTDFGIGDAAEHYVGPFPVAAPEVIVDEEGQEYITSNHDLEGGTQMCRLRWEEE